MFSKPLEEFRAKLSLADDALEGVAVMVLPENFETSGTEDILDTMDSIDLAKFLKAQGFTCKTAYDFGLKPKVYDRRGIDIWAGVVWIVEQSIAPIIVGAVLLWLDKKSRNEKSATSVHFELRLQDGDKTAMMKFDGPASSLEKLLSGIKDGDSLTNDAEINGH
jgi:hypothetical protein